MIAEKFYHATPTEGWLKRNVVLPSKFSKANLAYVDGIYKGFHRIKSTDGQFWGLTEKDVNFIEDLPDYKPDMNTVMYIVNSIPNPMMGTDPEFFLARGEDCLAAFQGLPDKKHPKDGWFWDGFQAETTTSAAVCHQSCAQSVQDQFDKLSLNLFSVRPKTVWRVPDMLLQTASDQEVSLGCDPSLNAYKMEGVKVPDPRALKFRFAGGHIHFQCDLARLKLMHITPDDLVKTLDALCGLPCVALAAGFDRPIRRRYYGLAGEYRLPAHGLEYRTLSNFYHFHPAAYHLVMDLARWAFKMGHQNGLSLFAGKQEDVISIINTSNVEAARELVNLNKELFELFHSNTYNSNSKFTQFWKAINGGFKAVLPDFGKDVLESWVGIQKQSGCLVNSKREWRHVL